MPHLKLKLVVITLLLLHFTTINGEFLDAFPDTSIVAESNQGDELSRISVDMSDLNFPNIRSTFITFPHLKRLILRSNNIETVSVGAFDNVPDLKYLDLSNNHIRDWEYFFSFGPHHNLEALILDNNRLEYPSTDNKIITPYKLPSLKFLSLRNVNMRGIDGTFFHNVPSLTHLDISENLSKSYDELFQVLPNTITRLYLEHSFMTRLFLTKLKNLVSLSLNGNEFEGIACWTGNTLLCFTEQINLQSLSLARCKLKSFSDKSFVNVNSLLSLNISDNLIQRIDDGVLIDLPNLNTLDLSKNPLYSVPNISILTNLSTLIMNDMKNTETIATMLKTSLSLPKLRQLFINGNIIESISSEIFNGLPALEALHLSRNSIKSLRFGLPLPANFQQLYLSHNNIEQLENIVISELKSLRLLDLRNNPLVELKVSSLKNFPTNVSVMLPVTVLINV